MGRNPDPMERTLQAHPRPGGNRSTQAHLRQGGYRIMQPESRASKDPNKGQSRLWGKVGIDKDVTPSPVINDRHNQHTSTPTHHPPTITPITAHLPATEGTPSVPRRAEIRQFHRLCRRLNQIAHLQPGPHLQQHQQQQSQPPQHKLNQTNNKERPPPEPPPSQERPPPKNPPTAERPPPEPPPVTTQHSQDQEATLLPPPS